MNTQAIHKACRLLAQHRILSPAEAREALMSPVFAGPTHALQVDETTRDWLHRHVFDFRTGAVLHSPFPWFRVMDSNSSSFHLFHTTPARIDAWHWTDDALVFQYTRHTAPQHKSAPASKMRVEVAGWDGFRPIPSSAMRYTVERFDDARDPGTPPFVYRPFCALEYLLASVCLPGATVLLARDHRPGKSVEWHKSREHYLILPQRAAARLAASKRGVTSNDLKRAAHWRRAHFRRLQNPRYIHKAGHVIPVRSAWVGPTEWTGSDRKVYRVVDLPS